MEIGEYKTITDIRIMTNRNPLVAKLANLEVSQGFEVTGEEGERINWMMSYAAKGTTKRFGRKRLGTLHYLVFRKA